MAKPRLDRVIQVALPLPLRQSYSYSVPDSIPFPFPGSRVRVPFGARRLIGYVVEDADASPPEKLRPVDEILDSTPLFSPTLLEFTKRVADYYLVPHGIVMAAAYPRRLDPLPRYRYSLAEKKAETPARLAPLLNLLSEKTLTYSTIKSRLGPETGELLKEALNAELVIEETKWKSRRRYRARDRVALLLPAAEAATRIKDASLPKPFAKVMKALLSYSDKGFPTVRDTATLARVPQRVLQEMAEVELVELFDLVPAEMPRTKSPHTLTVEQEASIEPVSTALKENRNETFLLFGVTGSGKTEVYLRLAQQAFDEGKTVLYLVPEISLTSFLARRLMERFGSDVAILHSSMNPHERVRQWRRVMAGKARLVIGPRSALFAPLDKLGLIIVDEEHDPSFKQHDFPRYHARDMAVLRGVIESVPVVLGSATPSIESFYNATENGKYRLLRMSKRVAGAILPSVEIVDMRKEFAASGKETTFSATLGDKMEECLQKGHQAVILRNRLGYSTFVLCRRCGKTLRCDDCSVALTYHRAWQGLKCHYCGRNYTVPGACPSCGEEYLQFCGEGTEKVEDTLATLFPNASIERMDRDAVRTAARFDSIWRRYEEGKIDFLVGTQMVAKGHDIANVTLVGVLSADFILGMPDFRAAERVFQLITQAAGRAGRGAFRGSAVIQSHFPEHYAVTAARDQDFETFYEKEIRYRKMMLYPPIGALAKVEFRGKVPGRVQALAEEAAAVLRKRRREGVRILGPMPPPLEKLEGLTRRRILLRAKERQRLRAILADLLSSPLGAHNGRDMFVEVDPYDLM